jgi:hypothetical protein
MSRKAILARRHTVFRRLAACDHFSHVSRTYLYSAEQRSAVITAALARPTELGLPFACWTLDRLVAYL